MAGLESKKLKAFTIIETMISLSLISLSIGIAFLLFNSTATSGIADREAIFMADETLQMILDSDLEQTDQFIKREQYAIDVLVDEHDDIENLDVLTIKIIKGKKELLRTKHLLIRRYED